jgi:hypothetical protein
MLFRNLVSGYLVTKVTLNLFIYYGGSQLVVPFALLMLLRYAIDLQRTQVDFDAIRLYR